MTLNALEEKPLPVYGEGKQIRDWLFVDDHIDGLWSAITRGKPGESYCIGGAHEICNLNLVRQLCCILDKIQPRANGKPYAELITFVKDRPGHDFRYATNTAKIQKDLGWAPKTKFDDGLMKTVEWYAKIFQPTFTQNDSLS